MTVVPDEVVAVTFGILVHDARADLKCIHPMAVGEIRVLPLRPLSTPRTTASTALPLRSLVLFQSARSSVVEKTAIKYDEVPHDQSAHLEASRACWP